MFLLDRKDQPRSLRKVLQVLVCACVLPALAVSVSLAITNYGLLRDAVEQQTMLLGRSVLADLERDLGGIEAGLHILATAPELQSGNLADFHARARSALPQGIVYNYILTDAQGRQLLNTLRPYGTALPSGGTPPQLARVFDGGKVVLTDLFTGPVTGKPAIAMGVPVDVGGKTRYSLNIGLNPAHLNAMLGRAAIPRGWLVAVFDAGDTIVARSREPERFVGLKVTPEMQRAFAASGQGHLESTTRDGQVVFTSFVTSPQWRWRVVVGAPRDALFGEVLRQLSRVLVVSLIAMALGLWLARAISLRLVEAVTGLSRAALAMRNGETVEMPALRLQEAEGVSAAFAQAAEAMRQVRFHAHHDALTGLPNRLQFEEAARRALAQAERRRERFAILAIDLDGFKEVNDRHGHAAGDEVLKMVADRLRGAIRHYDVACRMGGDEFVLLLVDVDADLAAETARRLARALSRPYGLDAPVAASIGVAVYPQDGNDLPALLAHADAAMYRDKAGAAAHAEPA